MSQQLPTLTLLETRIIGTLSEKQRTVPDTYPLSINALQAGCNQKTSRQPVMEASEGAIVEALEHLENLGVVRRVSGSRVSRFEHLLGKTLGIPPQAEALMTVLMLRGPQTAGELRLNCERLHRFVDISSVEAFLAELAERPEGALVVELPRVPGARENRWAHLLSGEPALPEGNSKPAAPVNGELESLRARVDLLESEMAELRALVQALQGHSDN